MFACILILILILFLPAALLPCMLHTFFSAGELNEMGIHLEESQFAEFLPDADISCRSLSLCV